MSTSSTGVATILLVEDEKALLEITQLNLESMGFNVLTSDSASQALALFESEQHGIDLLITDVVMPEMNGKTLYKKAQAIRKDLKYLYVSGYPADIIGRRGVIPDEVNFLAKPFTRGQLKEKIDSILSGV